MKKRLIGACSAVLSAVLMTVSAFAVDFGEAPPMNARGFLALALMSGALACAVALVVNYAQKFRDINRKDQKRGRKKRK